MGGGAGPGGVGGYGGGAGPGGELIYVKIKDYLSNGFKSQFDLKCFFVCYPGSRYGTGLGLGTGKPPKSRMRTDSHTS